jgi:hypothetical protein
MNGAGQIPVLAPYRLERVATRYWIRHCAGPRASFEAVKKKHLRPCQQLNLDSSVVQPAAHSQS